MTLMWLDAARYADSGSGDILNGGPGGWVLRAFQHDTLIITSSARRPLSIRRKPADPTGTIAIVISMKTALLRLHEYV
jgi:hypothetical protein